MMHIEGTVLALQDCLVPNCRRPNLREEAKNPKGKRVDKRSRCVSYQE